MGWWAYAKRLEYSEPAASQFGSFVLPECKNGMEFALASWHPWHSGIAGITNIAGIPGIQAQIPQD
eukprot:1311997-Pyramimonas_sp.AAC.1